MKFTKAFTVKGNIEKVFDLTQKYVSGMKFKIVYSVKPTLLILERGSTLGSLTSCKIEDCKTTLTISFTQKGEDVDIMCNYDVTVYGIVTSSDKSTLESEVELLKNFLQTTL
ncbi:MAG: hypothetical protein QW734_05495 [Candidatus Bathyarchaeia archaeon]